jgi:hypothetical protein
VGVWALRAPKGNSDGAGNSDVMGGTGSGEYRNPKLNGDKANKFSLAIQNVSSVI